METSADCPVSLGAGSFLKEYGATVGFTGAWADFMIESTLFNASSSTSGSPMGSSLDVGKDGPVLEPNGSGYVANKNRIVGVVSKSWKRTSAPNANPTFTNLDKNGLSETSP